MKPLRRGSRSLFVIGDRVLIEPEKEEHRTKVGLVLPAGVREKEDVRGGRVVAMGPGSPLPPPDSEQEPWKEGYRKPRYLPLELQIGDHAVFFRKAAIEVQFDDDPYLVVPYGAILVVVRGESVPEELPDDL